MDGTCGNCGGTLQGNPGETVRCGACGTSMAMPPPETGRFAAILAKADPVASLKRNWFLLLFAATFGWIDWTMHRSVVFVVVLANVALVLALFGNVLAAAVGLPRYTARFPRRWVPLVFAMVPLLYYALRAFGSFQDRLPIFLTTLGIVLLTIVAGPSLDQRLEPFYARRNRSLPGWSRRLAVPLLCFLATTLIIFGNFDGVTAMFGASPGAPPGESSLRLRTLLGGVLAATLAFLLLREADPAGRRRAAGASPLAHIVVPFVVAAMVALMVTLPHADAQGNGTAPYNPAPTYDPWTAPTTDPYTAPASPAYEPPAYNPYTPPPYDPYATPTYPAYQPPSPSAPLQPDPSDAASASPSLGEVTFECDPVASGEMASVTNSLCSQGDAIAALLNKGAKEGCYSDGDLAALDHQASQFYATLRTYPGLVGDTGLGAAQSMSRANSCSAGFAVAAAPAFIGAAAVAVAALPPPPIQVDPTAGREMRPYQGGRRFGSDAAQGDPSSARGPIRDREYLAEDPGAGGARLSTDMPEGPPPIGANPSESHALDAMPGRDPNPLVRAATGGEGGAIGGSAPPPPGYTGRGYSVDTGRQFQADSGPSSDIRLNPSQAQSLDTGRPVGTPAPDRSLDNPYAPPSPRGLPPPIGSDAPQDQALDAMPGRDPNPSVRATGTEPIGTRTPGAAQPFGSRGPGAGAALPPDAAAVAPALAAHALPIGQLDAALGAGQVTLSWPPPMHDPNEVALRGYAVYRTGLGADGAPQALRVGQLPAGARSFTDAVPPGQVPPGSGYEVRPLFEVLKGNGAGQWLEGAGARTTLGK